MLDCDGLLVDSETPWHRATAALFTVRGLRLPRRYKALLTGRTLDGLGPMLARILREDETALLAELLARVHEEQARAPRPMPGAIALVHRLAQRVPVAVASNSGRTALDTALAAAGLVDAFSVTISADDVARPKPDPLPCRTALARLGADPERAVVFEDSLVGATAARASGAFVVGVPSVRGVPLPVDRTVRSLAQREVRRWAADVRTSRAT